MLRRCRTLLTSVTAISAQEQAVRLMLDAWRKFRVDQATAAVNLQRSELRQCFSELRSPCTNRSDSGDEVPSILLSSCMVGAPFRRMPVAYHGDKRGSANQHRHQRHQQQERPVGSSNRRRNIDLVVAFFAEVLCEMYGVVELLLTCPEMDLLDLPCPRPPLRLVKSPTSAATCWRGQQLIVGGDVGGTTQPPVDSTRQIDGGHQQPLTLEGKLEMFVGETRKISVIQVTRDETSASATLRRKTTAMSRSQLVAAIDVGLLKSKSPSCGVGDARRYHHPITPTMSCPAVPSFDAVDGVFVQSIRGYDNTVPLQLYSSAPVHWVEPAGQLEMLIRSMLHRFSAKTNPTR